VRYIILQVEAWEVVIDILEDQVNSHERCGADSFSLYNKPKSRAVFKVKSLGALHPDFTFCLHLYCKLIDIVGKSFTDAEKCFFPSFLRTTVICLTAFLYYFYLWSVQCMRP
uniref:Uncharacterized protein n=1 Tax=Gouania willdenowi TaxID=441366 RepID=A0A8C5GUU7_GOUWI